MRVRIDVNRPASRRNSCSMSQERCWGAGSREGARWCPPGPDQLLRAEVEAEVALELAPGRVDMADPVTP
jgi:hypothetical protein